MASETQRSHTGYHCSFTVLLSERLLKPRRCGGKFLESSNPKCPNCSHPLSAVDATEYIEKNAPGTAKGWRWDQLWSGGYSIVLNEHIVEDWWDEEALARFQRGTVSDKRS
jgi:hypothetical protein